MIRHFQPGDVFSLQRLGWQAAKLNIERALTSPRPTSRVALTALMPWGNTKVITLVLHQQGNSLAHVGMIQLRKRPGRPEADVVFLAPDLDMPDGHPAIWQKLLSCGVKESANLDIIRCYVDLPDQPLPIDVFSQVGFTHYTQETIWRLARPHPSRYAVTAQIRPQNEVDGWDLHRLYARTTPEAIQLAEGIVPGVAGIVPPILEWWQPGQLFGFVIVARTGITGCIQIVKGERGSWLRLWCHTEDRNVVEQLFRCALNQLNRQGQRQPVYVGVRPYQSGLNTVLADLGFAPFTDRARMVKQFMMRALVPADHATTALDAMGEALPTPLAAQRSSSRTPGWHVGSLLV